MDVKGDVRSNVIIEGEREEFRHKMKLLDTCLNIKNVVMSATES